MKSILLASILVFGSCKAIDAVAGDDQRTEQVAQQAGDAAGAVATPFLGPAIGTAVGAGVALLTRTILQKRKKALEPSVAKTA